MVSPADGKTPAVVKTPPAVTPPPADPLPVPADLTGAAASIFARFAAALRGTIELSDSPVLSAASRHLAEAERCRDEAAKHSPSSTDFGRCHRAGLAAEGAANRILAAFMMTPAGRAKALAEKAAAVLDRPASRVLRFEVAAALLKLSVGRGQGCSHERGLG